MAGKPATTIVAAIARDVCGLAGAGSIVTGFALLYAPAGFIVAGVLMVTAAVMLARRG